MARGPSIADVKRWGATVAMDIHVLRSDGRTIAPFKEGLFRVGLGAAMDVYGADGLARMANDVQAKRRQSKFKTAGGNPPGDDAGTLAASRAGSVLADPSCDGVEGHTGPPGQPAVTYRARPSIAAIAPTGDRPPEEVTPADRQPLIEAGSQDSIPTLKRVTKTTKLHGRMANAGDGGEPPAKRCRPSPTVAQAVCPCGRPEGHGGRCWHRRGLAAPVVPKARGKHPTGTCATCGGLRSYWSANQCQACYRENPPSRLSQEQRIAALEADLAELKANIKDGLRELLARIDGREGR